MDYFLNIYIQYSFSYKCWNFRADAYLHAKFHLDPTNCLATVHQRHRQADRQWSDSIGRTVLQTVAEKGAN